MNVLAAVAIFVTVTAVTESAIPVYTVTGMLAVLLIRVLVVYSSASDRAEVLAASRVKEVVAQLERAREDHAAMRDDWQVEKEALQARIRQLEEDLRGYWQGKPPGN